MVCSQSKLTCWNPSHALIFSQRAKLSRFSGCVEQIAQARDITQCPVASYRSAYRPRLGVFGSKRSEPVFGSSCGLESSSCTRLRSRIAVPALAKWSISSCALFILRGVCRNPAWMSRSWFGSIVDFRLPVTRWRAWERCRTCKRKRKVKGIGSQGSRRPRG